MKNMTVTQICFIQRLRHTLQEEILEAMRGDWQMEVEMNVQPVISQAHWAPPTNGCCAVCGERHTGWCG